MTDRADPFVYALLFPMMLEGGEFEIKGKVSKSIIKNIIMFNRIWNIWLPDKYKIISIKANEIDDDYRPNNNKAISAFSGGLDASYVLYKNAKKLDKDFQYDLDKAVMIWGADIPIDDKESFDIAFQHAKIMTNDLGVELIPVATNYRDDKEHNYTWPHCYGSVVVACLNFFSKTYRNGLIASAQKFSGYTYPNFTYAAGTCPSIDRYYSSDTFKIVIDGYEHTRTERANVIKDWKVGLEHLRVCWRNKDKSKNCGYCEKCLRTKLNFMAVGVNHLPSMPNDLTEKELYADGLIQGKYDVLYFEEIYNYGLTHHTLSKKWLKILKKRIKEWRHPNIFKTLIQRTFSVKKEKWGDKTRVYILGFKINIRKKHG